MNLHDFVVFFYASLPAYVLISKGLESMWKDLCSEDGNTKLGQSQPADSLQWMSCVALEAVLLAAVKQQSLPAGQVWFDSKCPEISQVLPMSLYKQTLKPTWLISKKLIVVSEGTPIMIFLQKGPDWQVTFNRDYLSSEEGLGIDIPSTNMCLLIWSHPVWWTAVSCLWQSHWCWHWSHLSAREWATELHVKAEDPGIWEWYWRLVGKPLREREYIHGLSCR